MEKQKIEKVAELASKHFGYKITYDDIVGRKRFKNFVVCRVACTIIISHSGKYTLNQIARYLKCKNHTSIMHFKKLFYNTEHIADRYSNDVQKLFIRHLCPEFKITLKELYENRTSKDSLSV